MGVLRMITLPKFKTKWLQSTQTDLWNSGICTDFKIMTAVQNILCDKKLKCY